MSPSIQITTATKKRVLSINEPPLMHLLCAGLSGFAKTRMLQASCTASSAQARKHAQQQYAPPHPRKSEPYCTVGAVAGWGMKPATLFNSGQIFCAGYAIVFSRGS